MKNERVWSFFASSGISLATVIAGGAVLILQLVNPPWFTADYILTAILGLLVLIATSEIVERRRSTDRIESGIVRLIEADPGIQNQVLVGPKEIYTFWDQRVESLDKRMDSVRLNPRYEGYSPANHKYRSRLPEVAESRSIVRRYIVVFHDLADVERIERDLKSYPYGTYFVGYFEKGSIPFPMITFSIADAKDVTFGGYNRPYDSPGEPTNIWSRHPETVQVFQNYFEVLWSQCIKLVDNQGIRYDRIDRLKHCLSTTKLMDASKNERSVSSMCK